MKRSAAIIVALLACCPSAFALSPSLDVNQYAHKSWTVREGFLKGVMTSIAQTPDGYLWLGTEFGLFHFDGVSAVAWQAPPGEQLPSDVVRSLLAARDGRLWIGTEKGLASWKDGKVTHYAELDKQSVVSLLEDREGTIWTGGSAPPAGRLCAIKSSGVECYGAGGQLGNLVNALYQDGSGNLWVGAENALWRWKPSPSAVYPMAFETPQIHALIEAEKGLLLIGLRAGIRQLIDGKSEAYALPGAGRQADSARTTCLFRDRDGGLWIGTGDRGLLHVHRGRTDVFTQSDGLSGDFVYSIFEDREGDIWVATRDGLDRFHDRSVYTISVKQGLSNALIWSVLAARDGSLWFGSIDGLNRWKDGQIRIFRQADGLPDNGADTLFEDGGGRIWISTLRGLAYFKDGRIVPVTGVPGGVAHAIAGDAAGNLWVSNRSQGLLHLFRGNVMEQFSWDEFGHNGAAVALLTDPLQGGLWLGFAEGGVAYFKDGRVRASYGTSDGLGEGPVRGLQLDRDGTLWAATGGGLSRVKNGHVVTLTASDGLPCGTIHSVIEDSTHAFWLDTACGLVRIARTELDRWSAGKRTVQVKVLDASDGVRSHSTASTGYSPRVAISAEGRLLFLPRDGVSVLDPDRLTLNKLPPPVHIEQVKADGKTYDAIPGMRLPPLVRDVWIDFTALSLVAPEKVRFRYKLEGQDRDWKEVVNERKAQYSNLSPGKHSFHIIASNNDGVWNEAGASLDFSIAPAYYQTNWFRSLCAAVLLGLLWGFYRFRLNQVAQEYTIRSEERVHERTRIAGALHDTLLQSFQGSLIQMQAARNNLSRRPEQAGQTLDEAITMAEGAIAESRDAIQDLRSQPAAEGDLAELLTVTGQDLARSHLTNQQANGTPVIFRVTEEGERRNLDPHLQDEAYRIARELLRNAFQHAQARHIEADIRYEDRLLRIWIRDDGKGIEPEMLKAGGRAGHWGLLGMTERGKRIGAQLNFASGVGSGTEVELSIPSCVAYRAVRHTSPFQLFRKKVTRDR